MNFTFFIVREMNFTLQLNTKHPPQKKTKYMLIKSNHIYNSLKKKKKLSYLYKHFLLTKKIYIVN